MAEIKFVDKSIAIPWYGNIINIDYTVKDKNSNKRKNFKEYDINILGITDQSCYIGNAMQYSDVKLGPSENSGQTCHANDLILIRNKTIDKKKYSFLLKYKKQCYPIHMLFKEDNTNTIDIHKYAYSSPIKLKYRDIKNINGIDTIVYSELQYESVSNSNFNIKYGNNQFVPSLTVEVDHTGENNNIINNVKIKNNANTQWDNQSTERDRNFPGNDPTIYENIIITPSSSVSENSEFNPGDLTTYSHLLSVKYDKLIAHKEELILSPNKQEEFNIIYGYNYKNYNIRGNKFTFYQDRNIIYYNSPVGASLTDTYNFIPKINIDIQNHPDFISSYYIQDDKIIFKFVEDKSITSTPFYRKIYFNDQITSGNINTYFTMSIAPLLNISKLKFTYDYSSYNINVLSNPLEYKLSYCVNPGGQLSDVNNIALFYATKTWKKEIANDIVVTMSKDITENMPREDTDTHDIFYYKKYTLSSPTLNAKTVNTNNTSEQNNNSDETNLTLGKPSSDIKLSNETKTPEDIYYYTTYLTTEEETQDWKSYTVNVYPRLTDEFIGSYYIQDSEKTVHSYAYTKTCIEAKNSLTYVNDINTYIYMPDEYKGFYIYTNDELNHNISKVDRYDSYKINENDYIFTFNTTNKLNTGNLNNISPNPIYKNPSLTTNIYENMLGVIYNLYPESNNNYVTYLCSALKNINNDAIFIDLNTEKNPKYDFNANPDDGVVPGIDLLVQMQGHVYNKLGHSYIFTKVQNNNREEYKYINILLNTGDKGKKPLTFKLDTIKVADQVTNKYQLDARDVLTENDPLISGNKGIRSEFISDLFANRDPGKNPHFYDYEYMPYVNLVSEDMIEFYFSNYKKGWNGTTYTNSHLSYSPGDGAWQVYAAEIENPNKETVLKNYYVTYVSEYEKYKFYTIPASESIEMLGKYDYNRGIDGDATEHDPAQPPYLWNNDHSEYRLWVFDGNAERYLMGDDQYYSLFDYIDKYKAEAEYTYAYSYFANRYAILGLTYSYIYKSIPQYANTVNNYSYLDQDGKELVKGTKIYPLSFINITPENFGIIYCTFVNKETEKDLIYHEGIDNRKYGDYEALKNEYNIEIDKYNANETLNYIPVYDGANELLNFYNEYVNSCLDNYLLYFTKGYYGNGDKSIVFPVENGITNFNYIESNTQSKTQCVNYFKNFHGNDQYLSNYNLIFDYDVSKENITIQEIRDLFDLMNSRQDFINLQNNSDYVSKIFGDLGYVQIINDINNFLKTYFENENTRIQYIQVNYAALTIVETSGTSPVNIHIGGGDESLTPATSYDENIQYYNSDGSPADGVDENNYASYYVKTTNPVTGGADDITVNSTGTSKTYYFDEYNNTPPGYDEAPSPLPEGVTIPQGTASKDPINIGLDKWQDIFKLFESNIGLSSGDLYTVKSNISFPFGKIDTEHGIRLSSAFISCYNDYNTLKTKYKNIIGGNIFDTTMSINPDIKDNLTILLNSIIPSGNQVDDTSGAKSLLYVHTQGIYNLIKRIFNKIDEYNKYIIVFHEKLKRKLNDLFNNLKRTKQQDNESQDKIFVNFLTVSKTEYLSSIISLFNIYDILKNYDTVMLKARISAYLQRAYAYSVRNIQINDIKDRISQEFTSAMFVDEINEMSRFLQKYIYDNRKHIDLIIADTYPLSTDSRIYGDMDEFENPDNKKEIDFSEDKAIIKYTMCNGYNIYWLQNSSNKDFYEYFNPGDDYFKGFNIRYFLYDGTYNIPQNINIYEANINIKPFNGTIALSLKDFENKNLTIHFLLYYYDSFVYQIPINNPSFIDILPMYAITPDIYTTEKLKVKYINTGTKKQIKIQFNISGIENYIDTKLYQFSLEFSYRTKGYSSDMQTIYLNNGELIAYVDPVDINKSEFYIFTYRAKWTNISVVGSSDNDTSSVFYGKIKNYVYFFNTDDGFIYERINININDKPNIILQNTDKKQTYMCNLYAEQQIGNTYYYWIANQGNPSVNFELIKTVNKAGETNQPLTQIDNMKFYSEYPNYTLTYSDSINAEGTNYNKYITTNE